MKKVASVLIALVVSLFSAVGASAHNAHSGVQHNPTYTKWDIYEPAYNSTWTCHSASNDISVGYGDLSAISSSSDQNTFKGYIDFAVSKWHACALGTTHINMYTSTNNPVVKINTYSDSSDSNWGYNDFSNALVTNSSGTGGQHFVDLDIYINVASSKVPVSNSTRSKHVLAHELGHSIGLADLTTNNNDYTYSNYLMGRNNYSLTSPTVQDVKGAVVILGMHTTHNYNTNTPDTTYMYYDSIYHRKICSVCDGYVFETHTKANGVCTKCNH